MDEWQKIPFEYHVKYIKCVHVQKKHVLFILIKLLLGFIFCKSSVQAFEKNCVIVSNTPLDRPR